MAAKKFLRYVNGVLNEVFGIQVSAGAGNAGDIVALDDQGRIDSSMMPIGYGSETKSIVASEALAAGDFVNIYDNAGTPTVRKADASGGFAKRAMGFVIGAVANGANATVYYGNLNNQKSALTPGARQYLSATTPGATSDTPPSTAGHIVQVLGNAVAATEILVEIQEPIVLA
ncbi:MAG TPA: hypothetical protein VEB42_02320 [Chitinophagaceae bacterium]|nr:hypothetical protein [Chitinophagaceae bacterium]